MDFVRNWIEIKCEALGLFYTEIISIANIILKYEIDNLYAGCHAEELMIAFNKQSLCISSGIDFYVLCWIFPHNSYQKVLPHVFIELSFAPIQREPFRHSGLSEVRFFQVKTSCKEQWRANRAISSREVVSFVFAVIYVLLVTWEPCGY